MDIEGSHERLYNGLRRLWIRIYYGLSYSKIPQILCAFTVFELFTVLFIVDN